ncbi:MAG: sialidase family protein [Eubacteriales bacterium]|nr:sialidase family protein [Eubacteriales bacterium]
MDWRNIQNGWEIPTENYCDQPYIVVAEDGAWVVAVTTGVGDEGEAGQHVVTMRSLDHGKTWSDPVDVEPADGPEASYAVLLKAPSGRIFCFYNHNTDNLRQVKANFPSGFWKRVDSQGHYVFRYSDDCGKSWSKKRIEIPIRETQIDRENPYQGQVRFFWNVGRPLRVGTEAYLTLHKIGQFGAFGGYEKSEGAILHSPDVLTLEDPANAVWETLPDGEIGLRAPEGPVAEEQCLTQLSDGSFFCVYRTIAGSGAFSYSRDLGHTWTKPDFMRYPDGRRMKHPRAANFVWKLNNGCYLYWFHNNGGCWYNGRNPVWVSLGREWDAPDGKRIAWSDPEILLYDDQRDTRISYPDLVEVDGRYFISQTQKTIARVNEIDGRLIAGMMHPVAPEDGAPLGDTFQNCGEGFTLQGTVETDSGEVLRMEGEDGALIRLDARESRVFLTVHDGECATLAFSDVMTPGKHHVAVIVDAQAKIVMFVVDGVLSDGGDRPRGWFRMYSNIKDCSVLRGQEMNLFHRPLAVWEARALFHGDKA